jgi:hypothetical protein
LAGRDDSSIIPPEDGLQPVWRQEAPYRCATELQGAAMSRTIFGDAVFAIIFSIVFVTIARFLWTML